MPSLLLPASVRPVLQQLKANSSIRSLTAAFGCVKPFSAWR